MCDKLYPVIKYATQRLASLMKNVFLLLMVITGLTTVLLLPNAYSDFSPNDKYVIKATGYLSGNQTIFDSSMALQLTIESTNGSTIQSIP